MKIIYRNICSSREMMRPVRRELSEWRSEKPRIRRVKELIDAPMN